MSTITKEWLQQKIAEMEATRDDIPFGLDEDDSNTLAALRIALASLEAEPVAWTDEQELRDVEKDGCGYLFTINPITPSADPRRVIKLYSTPPAPLVPETLPCPVHLEPGLKFGKGVRTRCMLDALRRRAEYYAELEAMTPDQRAEHDAGIAEFKAMLGGGFRDLSQPVDPQIAEYEKVMLQAGSHLVIGIDRASGPDRTGEIRYCAPPGYVMVPVEPTEKMVIEGFESEPDEFFSKSEEWDAYQEMSGCEQAAHRAKLCWAAMIKAAPKQENI